MAKRKVLKVRVEPDLPMSPDQTPAACWNKKVGGFRMMIMDAQAG